MNYSEYDVIPYNITTDYLPLKYSTSADTLQLKYANLREKQEDIDKANRILEEMHRKKIEKLLEEQREHERIAREEREIQIRNSPFYCFYKYVYDPMTYKPPPFHYPSIP